MRRAGVAAAWFTAGWLCCFGQGLWGSKLHSLIADWRTWQGASPEKRARIVLEKRRATAEGRFDWVPTDMGRDQ